MTNKKHGTLYIGVTSDIKNRSWQHKQKLVEGFTKKYGLDKLVWYEFFATMPEAILKEKQLKKWNRRWKIELIEKDNPEWRNISEVLLN